MCYIPRDGRITGLSKIARCVSGYARRPQLQERLTSQIADAMVRELGPLGVLVVLEAEHTCMNMGDVVRAVSIENVLRGIGLTTVEVVNPLDHELAVETVRRVAAEPGVKAIIFRSPCVVLAKPKAKSRVDASACVGCQRCVRQLGCPALIPQADGRVDIDQSQCTGCTLCEQVCPVHAISGGERL